MEDHEISQPPTLHEPILIISLSSPTGSFLSRTLINTLHKFEGSLYLACHPIPQASEAILTGLPLRREFAFIKQWGNGGLALYSHPTEPAGILHLRMFAKLPLFHPEYHPRGREEKNEKTESSAQQETKSESCENHVSFWGVMVLIFLGPDLPGNNLEMHKHLWIKVGHVCMFNYVPLDGNLPFDLSTYRDLCFYNSILFSSHSQCSLLNSISTIAVEEDAEESREIFVLPGKQWSAAHMPLFQRNERAAGTAPLHCEQPYQ